MKNIFLLPKNVRLLIYPAMNTFKIATFCFRGLSNNVVFATYLYYLGIYNHQFSSILFTYIVRNIFLLLKNGILILLRLNLKMMTYLISFGHTLMIFQMNFPITLLFVFYFFVLFFIICTRRKVCFLLKDNPFNFVRV